MAGKSFVHYLADELLRSAVERQFEVCGEALARLRDLNGGLVAGIPDARKAIAFRNLLIHGYDVIRHEVVWDTVVSDVPAMRVAIAALLGFE